MLFRVFPGNFIRHTDILTNRKGIGQNYSFPSLGKAWASWPVLCVSLTPSSIALRCLLCHGTARTLRLSEMKCFTAPHEVVMIPFGKEKLKSCIIC